MDEDLKAYLQGLESRLEQKFSGVRTEIEGLRGEVTGLRDEVSGLRGEIEASETRLLTEFWKWGRAADQRIRRMEHSDATTTERLTAMEERIFTLERKVAGSKN
jgi:predicted RNase H-like nuclease (RuvC/YqgF family)